MMTSETEKRKDEHIDICLHKEVTSHITNGFDQYQFVHHAMPEIDFHDIQLHTSFLGKTLKAPFLISSMTGGTTKGSHINEILAACAQHFGWAMGIGSMRTLIENKTTSTVQHIRKVAPDAFLIANLGAVQFNYGFGIEECKQAIDMIEADALVFHFNSLQEVFQPAGNTNFKNLLHHIEHAVKSLPVPIGIKEVGFGIDQHSAQQFAAVGVSFIDVAGAGGTSWIQVEKYRTDDPIRKQATSAFHNWGIPTATCIKEIRKTLPIPLIASGGMSSGVEAAKAIALGSNVVGLGRTLLPNAVQSEEACFQQCETLQFELQAAMFGIGCSNIKELADAHQRLKKQN
ncbi:type 2 isopentenyl-diphosphate Delta-isomerase [Longirhabdus pacifica]|uniref:type 2 isopentenyl-diphosphate Delta-isomerase n=1 Tax=Longirhabdus pacifica TaxID=2305227 RepID=UPI0027BA92E0|nr:type 2 isopentenyl-diphosphate Delta-isomerase [Longirhabdus pacifica]